jgi:hypothetical protein
VRRLKPAPGRGIGVRHGRAVGGGIQGRRCKPNRLRRCRLGFTVCASACMRYWGEGYPSEFAGRISSGVGRLHHCLLLVLQRSTPRVHGVTAYNTPNRYTIPYVIPVHCTSDATNRGVQYVQYSDATYQDVVGETSALCCEASDEVMDSRLGRAVAAWLTYCSLQVRA